MFINNEKQEKSIAEKVIGKIKSGNIKMESRAHFVLKAVLAGLIFLILFLFLSYLSSFIVFSVRASGMMFLPKFGSPGIAIFFRSLPWLLFLTIAVLIILTETFAKKFTFVWRRPIIYSLAAIVIIVVAVGFLIDKTPFHSKLFLSAREGKLLTIGPLYRDFGIPKTRDFHYGIVSEIIENGFKMETFKKETLTIIFDSKTRFFPDKEIKKDDAAVVLGKRKNNTVSAFEIRRVEKDFDIFPGPRDRMMRPPFPGE